MDNFDLDNFLFGETSKKPLREGLSEKKEEIKRPVTSTTQKREIFDDVESIPGEDISLSVEKTQSKNITVEQEELKNKVEVEPQDTQTIDPEPKPESKIEVDQPQDTQTIDPEPKPELKIEVDQPQEKQPSREDIIKSIDVKPQQEEAVIKKPKMPEIPEQIQPNPPVSGQQPAVMPESQPKTFDKSPSPTLETQGTTEGPPRRKSSKFLKSFLVFLLLVLLGSIGFVLYENKDSLPFLQGDDNEVETPHIKIEEGSFTDSPDEIENSLDEAINKMLQSTYKVIDSGGFAIEYIEGEGDDETIETFQLSLGDDTDFTIIENGMILSFELDKDTSVVWQGGDKYIVSHVNKNYIAVNNDSSNYYQNFLGQHILQDLIDDYQTNKRRITQINDNTWQWDWSFYVPINDYTGKESSRAHIIIDPEAGYISEIQVFDSETDEQIGTSYTFSYEVLEEGFSEALIPEDYDLIEDEEDFTIL